MPCHSSEQKTCDGQDIACAVTTSTTYISENRFILSFPLSARDDQLIEFESGKLPWGGPDRAIKIAKARRQVLIPCRIKSVRGWGDACIHNISSRGMMIACDDRSRRANISTCDVVVRW